MRYYVKDETTLTKAVEQAQAGDTIYLVGDTEQEEQAEYHANIEFDMSVVLVLVALLVLLLATQ